MTELYQEAIRFINFPLSLLMVVVLIYWLMAIIGVLDFNLLDGNVELDVHGDLDGDFGGDLDGDLQADGHGDGHGMFAQLSNFLHVGDAPLTVVLSLLTFFSWTNSMLMNFYFNKADSIMLGVAFLIPNAILSLILSGIVVIPVAVFFRKLAGNENVKKDVLGDSCTVVSGKVDHTSGQAEVSQAGEGAPITVNARTGSEDEILTKGQKAVVVRKNDNGTYIIKALEN
jgi:hypothetical protein